MSDFEWISDFIDKLGEFEKEFFEFRSKIWPAALLSQDIFGEELENFDESDIRDACWRDKTTGRFLVLSLEDGGDRCEVHIPQEWLFGDVAANMTAMEAERKAAEAKRQREYDLGYLRELAARFGMRVVENDA